MNSLRSRSFALLCAVATSLVAASAGAQGVRLINSSDWNINYLFLSPTGNASWGSDQLGQSVLRAGGGWLDIRAGCGYYDLRFLDEDGDECVVGNIHLCNEAVNISNKDLLHCESVTQGKAIVAPTPVVRIVNNSQWNIQTLFISPTGNANWGPDQLGQFVLSGGGGSIEVQAACGYYDLRMTADKGNACVVGNRHLCNEVVNISSQDLVQCVAATP